MLLDLALVNLNRAGYLNHNLSLNSYHWPGQALAYEALVTIARLSGSPDVANGEKIYYH